MMKKYLLLAMAAMALLLANAQKPNPHDSLLYYFKKANFGKALSFAKDIMYKNKAETNNDSALAASINDVAFIYKQLGNYTEAETFYIESKQIRLRFFGSVHPEYANSLTNMASMYIVQSRYPEAEMFLKQAAAIFFINPGPLSSTYATVINNLANLYVTLGNYQQAESLQLKALDIRKKTLGDTSLDYAKSLNNLAFYYKNVGNYTAALPLYLQAEKIILKQTGSLHPTYAAVISNIGNIYYLLHHYDGALPFYTKALEISEKLSGIKSPDYALALNEMASLHSAKQQYDSAEILFLQSLAIRKEIFGVQHVDYGISLANLSGVYYLNGQWQKALPLMQQAIAISKYNTGEKHINYVNLTNNLANIYLSAGNCDSASYLINLACSTEQLLLLEKLNFLSEKELMAYLFNRAPSYSNIFSLLHTFPQPAVVQTAYNSQLLLKGISILNTSTLFKQMEQSTDSTVAAQWAVFKQSKILYNKTLSLPIKTRTLNTDSLANIANIQEKKLLAISKNYKNANEKFSIKWQDVKKHLNQNQVAIEFVRYNYLKKTLSEPDSSFYAALLLRPTDTIPIFINLMEEKKLAAALKSFAYKAGSPSITPAQKGSPTLYALLWKPLEKYLKPGSTVYFAADGQLHNLAFAAISTPNGSLLCNNYQLIQLTSTRQIALQEGIAPSTDAIALFGGINYNRQSTDTAQPPTLPDNYAYVYQQHRGIAADSFGYLPGTLKEINSIKKSMEQRQKKVSLYTGDKATESNYKKLAATASPKILHFATHGFALPDTATTKNTSFKVSDNPLLRSGLVLAGGNNGWQGKAPPNQEDGILTALEISNVPLPNTQLAVLSACETGTGDVRGAEGIFGLQRAFKIAGVSYVMASLWAVPDQITAEFMTLFYNKWLGGLPIRQAFLTTQAAMHKKYNPYNWAAFTLVQ